MVLPCIGFIAPPPAGSAVLWISRRAITGMVALRGFHERDQLLSHKPGIFRVEEEGMAVEGFIPPGVSREMKAEMVAYLGQALIQRYQTCA